MQTKDKSGSTVDFCGHQNYWSGELSQRHSSTRLPYDNIDWSIVYENKFLPLLVQSNDRFR